jgi:type IV pilus assembly protein PilA
LRFGVHPGFVRSETPIVGTTVVRHPAVEGSFEQEKKMLTRIMKPRDDRDAGFTLIELLVVVVIIGILAAIAIPVFLNQRNAARNASVESDVRNTATVMETYYTQNDEYPPDTASLTGAGGQVSSGNYVYVVVNADGSYDITGCNLEADTLYSYDSGAGGFQTVTGDCGDVGGTAAADAIVVA